MDFNFDTGAIYGGIQSIDPTALPPLGGLPGTLTISGTGSILIPVGDTSERPATPLAGMVRFNTQTTSMEVYDGTVWGASAGTGTVTQIDTAVTGTGISVTGAPITSFGTLTFELSNTLQGIDAISAAPGFIVQTSANVFAQRTILGTTDNISVSDGDGVGADPIIDLVDFGTPVSDAFVKITTDAKGRVQATSAVTTADITNLVDATYVNVTGDSMSGDLTFTSGATVTGLPGPINGSDAVNKAYADALIQGLSFKQSARAATTADITLSAPQTIDGVAVIAGERVLVKNQTDPTENGIYVAAAGAWVRSIDADVGAELVGAYIFIQEGTINANTSWAQISPAPITIGTTPIVWNQFSGAGTYTAGTGLNLSGTQFSLETPVTTVNGGTGTNSAPTAGQVLVGTSSGTFTPVLIGNGSGISVTSGSGSVSISNTGVLSFNTRTGAVTLTSGDVTSALGYTPVNKAGDTMTGALTVTGTITAENTDSSLVIAGGATSGSPVTITATGTGPDTDINLLPQGAGNVLVNGDIVLTEASDYVKQIVAGTNITISPVGGLGVVTINSTSAVSSIIAGTGISVDSATGDVTITNTGVTSVALSDASTTPIYSISGSPVTTTGTLTQTLTTQSAHTAFLGPLTGTAQPTFRAIEYSDLPIKLYSENSTSAITQTATADNSQVFGDGANAYIEGSKAFANGSFAVPGDAQQGAYVLRNTTTDATPTDLFIDGVSVPLVFPDNSVVTFDILVAARRIDATGGGAGYRFVGVARKDTTSASITFVGSPSKTILGETDVPWDITLASDTTNGSIKLSAVGQAGKTVQWVATVRTTEVVGG